MTGFFISIKNTFHPKQQSTPTPLPQNKKTSKNIAELTQLSPKAEQILNLASEKLQLSARSYFKTIKVARTIADLENSPAIEPQHLSEALQYRQQIAQ